VDIEKTADAVPGAVFVVFALVPHRAAGNLVQRHAVGAVDKLL